jgi:hypothetical protein
MVLGERSRGSVVGAPLIDRTYVRYGAVAFSADADSGETAQQEVLDAAYL